MTPQQTLFCEHLLAGASQAEAYRRAGYTNANANVAACRLVKQPHIAAHLEALKESLRQKSQFTRERALEVLRDIAEGTDTASARVSAITQASRMLGWHEPDTLQIDTTDKLAAVLAKVRSLEAATPV